MSDWISVEDRLPEYGEKVVVVDGDEVGISMRLYCNRPIYLDTVEGKSIATHWMPLPEPPNEN